jgi:hypothetical protein
MVDYVIVYIYSHDTYIGYICETNRFHLGCCGAKSNGCGCGTTSIRTPFVRLWGVLEPLQLRFVVPLGVVVEPLPLGWLVPPLVLLVEPIPTTTYCAFLRRAKQKI